MYEAAIKSKWALTESNDCEMKRVSQVLLQYSRTALISILFSLND